MTDPINVLGNLAKYLYLVIPLVQVLVAVHALKTGRSWYWLWIIMGFPLLGAAIYFFMEIMPDSQFSSERGFFDVLLNTLVPGRKLRLLREAVEENDSVKNCVNLAEFHCLRGEHGQAEALYRRCLVGAFKDDPEVSLALAASLVEQGKFDEPKKILEFLQKKAPGTNPSRRDLLYSRTLEGLGYGKEALEYYAYAAGKYPSEVETCYRYGLLLAKGGQKAQAREQFEKGLKKAQGFAAHHRRAQRPWIKGMKAALKTVA